MSTRKARPDTSWKNTEYNFDRLIQECVDQVIINIKQANMEQLRAASRDLADAISIWQGFKMSEMYLKKKGSKK